MSRESTSHNGFSLKRLKFGKRLMEEIRGDFLRFFDRGVNQAGGGNGVDLSWDTGRELVDQVFDIGIKDFFRCAGGFPVEVDVGRGLSFCEGVDVVMDGDTLSEVGMEVSFEDIFEVFLTGEDDFEMSRRIKGRTDKESEVGDGIGFQEVCLIDEEDGGEVLSGGFIHDLKEEAVFGMFWDFAKPGDD